MTNKCNSCGKFISSVDGAKCAGCLSRFHRACITKINGNKRNTPKWLCKSCISRSNVASTSIASSDTNADSEKFMDVDELSGISSMVKEIVLLRTELSTVAKEIALFRQEVSSLHCMLSDFNKRVDTIEDRMTVLEVAAKQGESNQAHDNIAQLRSELNDRDQDCLVNDIEISGLTEKRNENLVQVVKLIGEKLGVEVEERDIVFAKRIGIRRPPTQSQDTTRSSTRNIAVRLARYSIRNELLRAARVRRGADSSGLDIDAIPKRFFVNERLTRTNREMFYRARENGKANGWRFVWTQDGRILTRREQNAPVHRIRVEQDFVKVFGGTFAQSLS